MSNRELLVPKPSTAARKQAVLYVRVSGARQLQTDFNPDGLSIPAQAEACNRKAEQLDADVSETYIERAESAKLASRPELQRMLARIREQRDVDYVIVHKVDRFARNRIDDALMELELRKSGAQLVSVMENIDDTPTGRMIHGIMATYAEFYSANLATEAKKGMTQKAKVGGTPGQAPIGYLNVRQVIEGREIRTVALDPDRAPLIKWMWDAYASGDWSYGDIAEELERRGLMTRQTAKMPAHPLHRSHVEKIFSNPYYIGVVLFDGVEYRGRHPALIDRATFDKVQALRASRSEAREKLHKHPHYLKGSLVCDACGRRMGVTTPRGNGGLYHYFYCATRARRHGTCQQGHVSQALLERLVENYWCKVTLPSERIAEIRLAVQACIRQARSSSAVELEAQQQRLAKLERERAKAKEAYYADAMPLDQFRVEQQRLNRESAEAAAVIERCQTAYHEVQASVEEALALCADSHALYLAAPADMRRMLNQAVFSELRVRDEAIVTGIYTEGFAALHGSNLSDELAGEKERRQARHDIPAALAASWEEETGTGEALGTAGLGGSLTWTNPRLQQGQGSEYATLVGRVGLEPTTGGL